jgi:hypothetical protein
MFGRSQTVSTMMRLRTITIVAVHPRMWFDSVQEDYRRICTGYLSEHVYVYIFAR